MFIGKFKNNRPFPEKVGWDGNDHIIYDQVSSVFTNDRVKVCFWGVLYNKKSAAAAKDFSDAVIIAELYERSGECGFSGLDGSFTFVVSDSKKTIVVRDHHGTSKPVYYNNFFFASSLSLLQETDGFVTKPNLQALADFLSIGYIAIPFSSLEGVSKLGAGEMLIHQNGQSVTRQLYPTDNIEPARNVESLEELSAQYGTLQKEVTKRV